MGEGDGEDGGGGLVGEGECRGGRKRRGGARAGRAFLKAARADIQAHTGAHSTLIRRIYPRNFARYRPRPPGVALFKPGSRSKLRTSPASVPSRRGFRAQFAIYGCAPCPGSPPRAGLAHAACHIGTPPARLGSRARSLDPEHRGPTSPPRRSTRSHCGPALCPALSDTRDAVVAAAPPVAALGVSDRSHPPDIAAPKSHTLPTRPRP